MYGTKTVEEVTEKLIDYRGKTPKKTESGIKLITAKVIKSGFIVDGDHEYIARRDYDLWMRRGMPRQWDILITTEAPLGELAQLRSPEQIALAQRVILLRGKPSVINQSYFFHALKSPIVQAELRARCSGTTVLGIKQSELLQVKIPCPPLPIQDKIAALLSPYDSLIENNTRRIKILEEIAQRIYREWFVTFRLPGHEQFRLEESEFGRVPRGWCQPYPDYVNFLEGPGLRRWQYRDSGLRFLNIRTIANGDVDLSRTQFVDPAEAEAKYKHFLLSEYDHVVSSSGTIGRIVTIRREHLPLMLNTSVIRMRPKSEAVGKWQLKHFLKSDYFQTQIKAFASGVAQMNFGPLHLKQMKIIAPPASTGRAYEKLVAPIEELICALTAKNTLLRQTRDLLLPKLVSGEVSFEELETEIANQVS
ncbi:MAG: restriction endonuclease subunit S [Candidatus Acidiferrales bacterium]